MKISKNSFFSVGSDVKIPVEQLESFWKLLEEVHHSPKPIPKSNALTKCLFFLGAWIVISAMTWLMNMGWETFGGGGIFLISTGYALLFTCLGYFLWNKPNLRNPAGLFITMAVSMTPLAIYGLETYFNLWTDPSPYHQFYGTIDGKWIYMELGTILMGCIALYFFSFPAITLPTFVAVWFLMMDLIPFIFGKNLSWDQKCWVTLASGLILIIVGLIIDRKKNSEYALFSYLFGALSFWGSLNCLMWDKGELILFLFFLINLLMVLMSLLLKRNIFMIFGTIGIFAYLSYQAHVIFKNAVLFPFILSFIGLVLIYLGILYQRNHHKVKHKLWQKLPTSLKNFLEKS